MGGNILQKPTSVDFALEEFLVAAAPDALKPAGANASDADEGIPRRFALGRILNARLNKPTRVVMRQTSKADPFNGLQEM